MREIKPFGSDNYNGITPKACMCSSDAGFYTGKTPSDNCFYCGFQCDNDFYVIGNQAQARDTFRKS